MIASHRAIITLDDGEIARDVEVVHCCHCGLMLGPAEALLHQLSRGENQFGWCSRCNALHHAPGCCECRPQEKGCENVEAGRDWHDDGTAVRLYLPVSFPGK